MFTTDEHDECLILTNITDVIQYKHELDAYLLKSYSFFFKRYLCFKRKLFIIITIIKSGRQCKAEIEWYTPYQSEDPWPTIPTDRQKEETGENSRRL